MHIRFTQREVIDILWAQGYEVRLVKVEREFHHHGSRFLTERNEEYRATKNGITTSLEGAFKAVIKDRLLRR